MSLFMYPLKNNNFFFSMHPPTVLKISKTPFSFFTPTLIFFNFFVQLIFSQPQALRENHILQSLFHSRKVFKTRS